MATHQYSLALISHTVNHTDIPQRSDDGYINATDMCKASGKLFADYARLGSTKEFLAELQADMGIPISELVQSIRGGEPQLQGTWVHPQVAIHLAQWLSPKFAVQVSKWVYDWMSGKQKAAPAQMPFHLERHMINLHKIPNGYFSVLQEMTAALVAPLEAQGYRLPEHMMPDISHGRMLCKHLRDKFKVDTDAFETYTHTFPDGREVEAKLYPVQYLGEFRVLLADVWMQEKAAGYFKTRDPAALIALDKILLIGHTSKKPANTLFKKKA